MSIDIQFSDLSRVEPGALYANDFMISRLSTDTRSLEAGDTYLALKGERFDGHNYVSDAVSSGASSLIVSSPVDIDVPVIQVDDTLVSLGNIAKLYRNKLRAKVVGITGSNGKTTVKGMVTCICAEHGVVTATVANNNNKVGVPLTLLSATQEDDYLVVEMGTSEAGEIAYLANIVEPDISIVTTVSESHLEGIGSRDDVFEEKSSIIAGTRKDGVVVVNMDGDYSHSMIALTEHARVITYGFNAEAEVNCEYETTGAGSYVRAHSPNGAVSFQLSVPGRHNVSNALAAIAISNALDIDNSSIIAGLQKYSGVKGRLQTRTLAHNIRLIDDTYNANPASSMAAIDVLAEFNTRKIFVFAGMAELGDQEYLLHRKVGEKASVCGVDRLYVYGDMAKPTYDSFEGEKYQFDSIDDLTHALCLDVAAGDTILVKGSRRFQLDRVSRFLEEEFA